MTVNLPNVASASNADKAFQSVFNILAGAGTVAEAQTASRLAYFDTNAVVRSYAGINTTVLGYLEGITEDVQDAINAAAMLADTQTFTGVNTFDNHPIVMRQIAAPAAPAAGYTGVYCNATGLAFIENGGTEVNVAGKETANTFTANNTFNNSLLTASNVGTPAAVGTVVVREEGDGMHHVTTISLTDYVVGPLAGAAAALTLVPPQAIYVFPTGVHLYEVSYMSIALTAAGTAVSPEIGLGSVIGDGSANATIGAAGATMEDIMEGFTVADTVTHAAVANGPVGATAGILTDISLNKAADSKNVFLNCAGTWNADNTGNLTASGTIVIKWTTLV